MRSCAGVVLLAVLALASGLDRAVRLDAQTLSDEPSDREQDGLERPGGPVDTRLARSAEADRGWAFAARTVARVPAPSEEFGYGVVDSWLPGALVKARVLDVALWQWLALLVVAAAGWASAWLVVTVVGAMARRVTARSTTRIDDALVSVLRAPARAALTVAFFAGGVLFLALALPVLRFLVTLEKAALVMAIAWAALRVVDVFAAAVAERLAARGQTAALAMMPIGSKASKVLIGLFAALATLQNVGVNVTGVLAGLGIGGLAVALAAQKTVENLFGGVTLLADQPVRVGDFCRFGERIGTVEEVGLRSTRVRTLDRTVVSVPNAEFASLQLENFTRRDRIWLRTMLGLRYETTPDQLRGLLADIGRLLREHPRVEAASARIRFVGFGAYSLDCEIFAYVLTADYGEFLAIREEIFLRIMDAVAAGGTSFAFPSQTLYLGSDAAARDGTGSPATAALERTREDRV